MLAVSMAGHRKMLRMFRDPDGHVHSRSVPVILKSVNLTVPTVIYKLISFVLQCLSYEQVLK